MTKILVRDQPTTKILANKDQKFRHDNDQNFSRVYKQMFGVYY